MNRLIIIDNILELWWELVYTLVTWESIFYKKGGILAEEYTSRRSLLRTVNFHVVCIGDEVTYDEVGPLKNASTISNVTSTSSKIETSHERSY